MTRTPQTAALAALVAAGLGFGATAQDGARESGQDGAQDIGQNAPQGQAAGQYTQGASPPTGDEALPTGEGRAYDVVRHADWQPGEAEAAGAIVATSLLDMPVVNAGGTRIGRIEDAFLGLQNRLEAVSADVDPIGTGTARILVPWEEVSITAEGVGLPVDADNIASYTPGGEANRDLVPRLGQNDPLNGDPGMSDTDRLFRLSGLVDGTARVTDGANFGLVENLYIAPDGAVGAVVLSGDTSYGGETFPFSATNLTLSLSPGSPGQAGPGSVQLLEPLDPERVAIVLR